MPTTHTQNKGSATPLHIEDFIESHSKQAEKKELASKTLVYHMEISSLQKYPEYSQKTLKPLWEFLTSDNQNNTSQSNIYYMGLVDKNGDSGETIILITEKMQAKHQNGHLIVQDGKTYEHLKNIKHHYGSELDRLLIFPGDWHILKNYQEVLMKVYYSCGLKELAKCSGFRAETLTSLEKCSNFKRTHLFLMQVWEALYREIFEAFGKNQQGTALPLFAVVLSEVQKHLQTTASLSQLQSHIQLCCCCSGKGVL